jgi:hypothetical protein
MTVIHGLNTLVCALKARSLSIFKGSIKTLGYVSATTPKG